MENKINKLYGRVIKLDIKQMKDLSAFKCPWDFEIFKSTSEPEK